MGAPRTSEFCQLFIVSAHDDLMRLFVQVIVSLRINHRSTLDKEAKSSNYCTFLKARVTYYVCQNLRDIPLIALILASGLHNVLGLDLARLGPHLEQELNRSLPHPCVRVCGPQDDRPYQGRQRPLDRLSVQGSLKEGKGDIHGLHVKI